MWNQAGILIEWCCHFCFKKTYLVAVWMLFWKRKSGRKRGCKQGSPWSHLPESNDAWVILRSLQSKFQMIPESVLQRLMHQIKPVRSSFTCVFSTVTKIKEQGKCCLSPRKDQYFFLPNYSRYTPWKILDRDFSWLVRNRLHIVRCILLISVSLTC